MAWSMEKPCLRLKEIVAEGSCPEWLTVSGTSFSSRLAKASSGTSLLLEDLM
jgi:hypothetical protein